ncbi:hypothetical protein Syun_027578 [Stephania yunnanensis]|uniref:26S proteasome non-ATPase regulatory subunit 5 n=1 Tax=Stephania yunnanensis TaxID=152371 RepID=A0AAP0HQ28_9MAGN
MEEEFSLDPSHLLESASDFAHFPGVQNDASAKSFLDRFPLPVIISALQTKADVPGLEMTLVECLERIFKTKYGSSLIPQFMTFVQVGLQAESQVIKRLACTTVCQGGRCFLEGQNVDGAAELVDEYGVYPLLLNCLIHGDEQVAASSMDAIKGLTTSSKGIEIVFPVKSDESTSLRNVLAHSSSLGQVRVLALIVKLFCVSSSVASIIYGLDLLSLLVAQVSTRSDLLMTLSVLELLYELSEIPHGAEFLPIATFLQLLISFVRDKSVEPMLRSRSMVISGRLLTSEGISTVEKSSVINALSAIDETLELLKGQDTDESESGLEALGQIGSYHLLPLLILHVALNGLTFVLAIQGAELLLSSVPPVARHVIDAAFDRQGRGVQLAALHALGNISGEGRPDGSKILNDSAEVCLRCLIFEKAAKSAKLTPSGLFLSLLQKESEIRWAAYRLISGLVARPWCLIEICSKPGIIDIVTDANTESAKNGMEARHKCCEAIYSALSASCKLLSDPSLAGMAAKLNEAVRRGPYQLSRERAEAQPVSLGDER